MELSEFITKGIDSEGNLIALAAALGTNRTLLSDARSHRKSLPNYACIKLAKLIGADPLEVITASEVVTEKDEKKRAEWLSLQFLGAPETIRTSDPCLRRAVLYPAELRARGREG